MTEAATPIEVSPAVLPSVAAAALRTAVAVVGPSLIASGYLPAGSLEGVTTIVITAASICYGIWKTHQRKVQLVAAADAAPNSKFVLKQR
jgi:hypothetical protein